MWPVIIRAWGVDAGSWWGVPEVLLVHSLRGAESMVMKFHGNVRGEVRVNFLTLFSSKSHIVMCGALKLSGIVRANVRLNIAIPMLFWSLILHLVQKHVN